MLFNKIDIPNDTLYEYTPRPPIAEIPPVGPHEFEYNLHPYCGSGCKFSAFHDCVEPPSGDSLLSRIPKRRGYLMFGTDSIKTAWGIQARHKLHALIVCIYHLLIIAGPFVFWGWWQSSSPGDFQNASIPLTVVLGLLSLFWSSAGVLKAFR